MIRSNECEVKFVCELEVVNIINLPRMARRIPFSIQCDTGESNTFIRFVERVIHNVSYIKYRVKETL